jgi:hypothetical protein
MNKKTLIWIGVGLAIAGGVIGFKFYNKGKAEADVKQVAIKVVHDLPGYEKDPKYYDALLEHAHPAAFDDAYTMGGRRRAAKFDSIGYMRSLLARMAEEAKRDNHPEVSAALKLELKGLPAPKE